MAALEVTAKKGVEAGLPENAYYFALNRDWLKREFEEKIKVLEKALVG